MSDKRYSQEELSSLRFSSLDWGAKPAMLFADAEGSVVRIPITRATATKIVRSALPVLLPIDGDRLDATGAPILAPTQSRAPAYVQLGRCDGALFNASTTSGEPTLYFKSGRRIERDELPETMRASADDLGLSS